MTKQLSALEADETSELLAAQADAHAKLGEIKAAEALERHKLANAKFIADSNLVQALVSTFTKPAPQSAPTRAAGIARPSRCSGSDEAGCTEQALPGSSYCAQCLPKAHLQRRRWALRQAYESLPEAYGWAEFSNPALAERVGGRELIASVSELVVADCIVFCGPTGSGKSSLAVAMARAILAEGHSPQATAESFTRAKGLRYVRALGLASSWAAHKYDRASAGRSKLLQDAAKASVLVLDDLGAELRDFGPAAVTLLVHERNDSRPSSIITTWLDEQSVANAYGGAVARRIFERSVLIKLGGEGC